MITINNFIMKKLKWSERQYRNIKGIRYEMYTSNPDEFEACKIEAKEKYLKYRIIDQQFYIQRLETAQEISNHAEYIANAVFKMPYCKQDIIERLTNNVPLP